ncbi:MAG: hypothetical protein FJW39_10655 [Acidobacteria bacterium]|nr:hypothetical protein [Acidobacteriota bacterium]
MRLILFALAVLPLVAQTTSVTCDATADPTLVRQEGVTETLGPIHIVCTAFGAGTLSGGIIVYTSAPVTNRLGDNDTIDARLTAETAGGTLVIGGNPILIGNNGIVFQTFSVPLGANGQAFFRITNIRVAPPRGARTVTAFISTNGISAIGVRNNPVTAGVVQRGLLAAATSTRVVCRGATVPSTLTFADLYNSGGTYFSFRVTENEPGVFHIRTAGTTNGQRFLIKYSGFPADARLFVPTFIAGSSAVTPTSVGEFGLAPTAGVYRAGSNGLLLTFVAGADGNGAGGAPVVTPDGLARLNFGSVSEVPLFNGAGTASFEIVDTNPFAQEFAVIPTFITVPFNSANVGRVASASISFGPLSQTSEASRNAPFPRYLDMDAPPDCEALRDCNASYFPKLQVRAPFLTFDYQLSTQTFASHYITVNNEAGGIMPWVATISYRTGFNWLIADPSSGINNASINLRLKPEGLQVGHYEAVLRIEAGQAGVISYPVSVNVRPGPPVPPPAPDPNAPRLETVGSAADLSIDGLVPDSLATITGSRLAGNNLQVHVGDTQAFVISATETRITFVVPAAAAGMREAGVTVTANGLRSAIKRVQVLRAAPVIFGGGVINTSGAQNSESDPERVGQYLQVFATGLPPGGSHLLSARLHDRDITEPAFAGPAPGQPGVIQFNLWIPDDLPAMQTEVRVCGTLGSDRVCSPGHRIWITR